jgi:uncharacterized protein with PQ loop repeat
VHHHIKHKKSKNNRAFDALLYFFAISTPLFVLPQAYLIYSRQDAENVSLITWTYFMVSSLVWLVYGLRQKIKPVIFSYSLYLLMETTIVIGIILYR